MNQFKNNWSPYRPIIPTGAAYGGSGWYPTSDDIVKFMDKVVNLGMTAVNFWSWDYCRLKLPAIWETIADYEWPGCNNPPADITETLFKALNEKNVTAIVNLYASDALHITADRTIQGQSALKQWYTQILNFDYSGATFEITELSGDDPSRYFSWEITLSNGTVKTGSDTIGLSDSKIIYHYSTL
jgi:hypothetical protein